MDMGMMLEVLTPGVPAAERVLARTKVRTRRSRPAGMAVGVDAFPTLRCGSRRTRGCSRLSAIDGRRPAKNGSTGEKQ
jgi:hypothetical protein